MKTIPRIRSGGSRVLFHHRTKKSLCWGWGSSAVEQEEALGSVPSREGGGGEKESRV